MEISTSHVVKNLSAPFFIPTSRRMNQKVILLSALKSARWSFHQTYRGRLEVRTEQRSRRQRLETVAECGKGGSASAAVPELEKLREYYLGDERVVTEEELKGLLLGGKFSCKEIRGGVAELMECLEREAIMGEDHGIEPTDYNRRALIFDKSSRVFQALREDRTDIPLP